ncbi:MAG: imidazoleglycerol-phosphate dehydratase HisB [Clostridia bacterium]|nr:imidazoleglycerol-phosphate dehydratase HisB [Clostridia bacterium]
MRMSKIERKTYETDITLELNLDGTGESEIDTGVGFFDHMLTLFSKHGMMDLKLKCNGDIHVDCHHTIEDIGIVMGKAFAECIKDKNGILRYASEFTPMDETLVQTALDISGRPYLVFNADFPQEQVGQFDTEMTEEFFRAFAYYAQVTLHINLMYGKNTHHMIEAIFKSVGRIFNQATKIEGNEIMSTKGVID